MDKKKCPVDRGKLLIGLEICINGERGCTWCQYCKTHECIDEITVDTLRYIYWLEEQVKEATENAGNDDEGRQDPDDA